MKVTNEMDSIMTALQQRFDYNYGIGLSGFDVEGGSEGRNGYLIVYNSRNERRLRYEVKVKFRLGEYNCKIEKFREYYYDKDKLIKTFTMVFDDPQEVVDWVIKMIAPSAKTIDINESYLGSLIKEDAGQYVWTIFDDNDGDKLGEEVDESQERFDNFSDAVKDGLNNLKKYSDGHYYLKVWDFGEEDQDKVDNDAYYAEINDGSLKESRLHSSRVLKEGYSSSGKRLVDKICEWASNRYRTGDNITKLAERAVNNYRHEISKLSFELSYYYAHEDRSVKNAEELNDEIEHDVMQYLIDEKLSRSLKREDKLAHGKLNSYCFEFDTPDEAEDQEYFFRDEWGHKYESDVYGHYVFVEADEEGAEIAKDFFGRELVFVNRVME